jgi:multiple sugar transport system permease protein
MKALLHRHPSQARNGAVRPMPHLAAALALVLVLAGALLMLAPFYLMFVFATHTDSAILSLPPPLWFGDALGDNLRTLLLKLPALWQNLGYSLYVALAITAPSMRCWPRCCCPPSWAWCPR